MKKFMRYLLTGLVTTFLVACEAPQQGENEWANGLDLCQLATWRPDAYPELYVACNSAADADQTLVRLLAKRSQCVALNDFTGCREAENGASKNEPLDRARRLAMSSGKPLESLLAKPTESEKKQSWRSSDRLNGWKKELDENGILKGKYATAIKGTRWNASEIDWVAYHAFASENAKDENHRLISNITVATALADMGFYEEAKANLERVSNDDLERVLRPDWTLYGTEQMEFSKENKSYQDRSALSAYRKTVAAIFAVELHSNNRPAAKKTLEQSRNTLTQIGPNGIQYINLMEFLLGADVEDEHLFEKLYLGPQGKNVDYDIRGIIDGLRGWESLADNTALAPLLASRLKNLNIGLPEHEYENLHVSSHDPNMSDTDFLNQPSQLRAKMAYYKTLLKEKIRTHSWAEDTAPTEITPPAHVSFEPQKNTPKPIPESLMKRIQEAGIGSYGVVASREIELNGIQIVYSSNAIDPSGETGVGAYWLLEGYPQKDVWKEPVYLGLRTLLPYTIDGFATDLPKESITELDSLTVLGTRQPLNLGSLTFPPIAMETSDPERGIITIDLNIVKKDRDGDRLTDLFEERVGLNPDSRDTDGDGITDNRDSVPTRPYAGTSQDRSRAYALLSIREGHEDGAIIQAPTTAEQIEKDPLFGLNFSKEADPERLQYTDPIPNVLYLQSDFEGLGNAVLPYMLIVQTKTEADKISETFPPHYPIVTRQIKDPFSDRMIVIWSASWVGGTVLLTRQPTGGYKREVLSSWIT